MQNNGELSQVEGINSETGISGKASAVQHVEKRRIMDSYDQ